jgi:PAS domain S-box-containing protein
MKKDGDVLIDDQAPAADMNLFHKLAESEKKFHDLVDKAGIGILIDDTVGNIVYFNDKFSELFGYTRNELEHKKIEDLVHPDDIIEGQKAHHRRLASCQSYHRYQFRGIKKDRSQIYLEVDATFHYENNAPVKVRSYIRDITDRKTAEKAIRKSELKYRKLFDDANDSIFVIDEGRFIDANKKMLELHKYSLEEILNKRLEDLSPEFQSDGRPSCELIGERIRAVLSGKPQQFEWTTIGSHGRIIHSEVSLSQIDLIEKKYIIGFAHDITDRRLAAQKISEQNEILQILADFDKEISRLEVGELIGRALDFIRDRIKIKNLGCLLYNKDLRCFTISDIRTDLNIYEKGHRIPLEETNLSSIMKSKKPLYRPDIRNESKRSPATEKLIQKNIASDFIIPLVIKDKCLGFFNAASSQPDGISDWQRHILTLLSLRFAEAVQNAELYERLQHNEKQIRTMFEAIHSGIVLRSSDGMIKYANNVACDIMEMSFEELTSRRPDDPIWHMVDGNGQQVEPNGQPSMITLKTGRPFRNTVIGMYSDKPDKMKWLLVSTEPLINPQTNEIYEALLNFSDITAQKTAEMALRKSEKKWRDLFENMRDGWVSVDMDGNYKECNDAYLSMLGYTREELKQITFHKITPETWHDYEADVINNRVIKNGYSGIYEKEYIKKDGTVFPIEMVAYLIRDDEGKPAGMWGIARDITERKRAEEALVTSEKRYQELFNSVQEGLCMVDESEVILFCNPAAAQIFEENSAVNVIGNNILDYIAPEQREYIFHETELRRQGKSSQYDIDIITARGKRRKLLASVSPRIDEDGKFIGAFGGFVDITEIRRLQELEARAQRLETAGRIAGQVAHDFNNLLAPLVAYPDFIREELPINHPVLNLIDDMENSARQIADINQQLLTLGRRGHYNQETINLNDIVKMVTKRLESKPETLAIDTALEPDLMNINGGRSQILRVVSNLVYNAIDAVQKVGQVTIRTENYYADEVSYKYGRVPKGEYVKLTVSDTGAGIPEDIQQKIFEPFFTTKTTDKKRGSGLGLSVVDAVIKDHNGYIDLESTVGRGTSVYIYFPITRDTIETGNDTIAKGKNEKILVVDDDAIQREVTVRLLKKLGYDAASTGSGESVVRLLNQTSYDLVILDMVMPGMDGTETYRRILEINPDQKAIIVSGFAETNRVDLAHKIGAGDFIKKPLTLKIIAAAVRKELDRKLIFGQH